MQEDGTEQMLLVASASSFPLWVIEKDGSGPQKVVQVPMASETGLVDPRRYRCAHCCYRTLLLCNDGRTVAGAQPTCMYYSSTRY